MVDITSQIERKLLAVAAYASQFGGKTKAGEVFPGGDRPLLEQIRAQCAHYGSRIRAEYGEPFRVDETFAVETLGALGVSSF